MLTERLCRLIERGHVQAPRYGLSFFLRAFEESEKIQIEQGRLLRFLIWSDEETLKSAGL